jgi:glycosyltransferase involved in cell wall biosynthesis
LHTESSKAWGGQENRTLQECIGLRKLGARVIVLCQPDSLLGQRASGEGFDVRTCRMRKNYDFPAVHYILKLIRNEAIDVLNTHSGRDSFLAGLAGRLSGKKPVIVRTRHLALPITSKITYSVLPHTVVTVSEYVRQHLIQRGVNPAKAIAIPTGVDLRRFDPAITLRSLREELKLGEDVPVIGTVAIFRINKGYHILLDAIPLVLKNIPDAVFVFAGDGPYREHISDKIQSLGLVDTVFMLGLRSDIPNILKSLDLFVLPTLQEALGTSFIEAMAMEKPVIGTDVGGVREVIEDGINGYLVPPSNPSMLADAITTMLKNREKAGLMGMEGRKIVLQRFNTDVMCERMHQLYLSLLNRKIPEGRDS